MSFGAAQKSENLVRESEDAGVADFLDFDFNHGGAVSAFIVACEWILLLIGEWYRVGGTNANISIREGFSLAIACMASALDVVSYVLEKTGLLPAMRLQKLVYYAQSWSLVWDEKPLFQSRVEAWTNSPIAVGLYDAHRGQFEVERISGGHSESLSDVQRETIDKVLKFYGDRPAQWLSDLTHMEEPWRDARKGLAPGEHGGREITHAAMAEYYGSL